jgi:hypothetical protein
LYLSSCSVTRYLPAFQINHLPLLSKRHICKSSGAGFDKQEEQINNMS